MDSQKILTESEEMYLVTIRKICEDCTDTPIPIPEIANGLGVQPVSVNQMIKKLSEMGLVTYTPYKGVELSPQGWLISNRILRHRRLWEVFLVQHLNMDLDEADALACQIEHATTTDVGDQLSALLDHPKICFHGDPIPRSSTESQSLFAEMPLIDLKVGQASPVKKVEADELTVEYLSRQGIRPGVQISLQAIGSNGEFLLKTQNGNLCISEELAVNITVVKPSISRT